MPTYKFHLADRVLSQIPGVWGEGMAYVVGSYLKEFFDQVCTSPLTTFSDSDFHWNTSSSEIRSHEVLIYFLPTKQDSLIRQESAGAPLGPGGTTLIRTAGNLSEVYVTESIAAMGGGADLARGFAVLAFHEAMHNKLKKGGSLHSNAVGGGGMAAGTVFANTQLTTQNIEKMARALGNSVPQNTSYLSGLPQSTADLW